MIFSLSLFYRQKCFTLVCWQFVSGLQSSGYQHTEGEGLDNEVFTQRWPELLHLTFITLHNDIQHVYDIYSQQVQSQQCQGVK